MFEVKQIFFVCYTFILSSSLQNRIKKTKKVCNFARKKRKINKQLKYITYNEFTICRIVEN